MPDFLLQPQPVPAAETWLKPLSAEDWFALPEPKTRWLVRGLVPAEGLVMLSGPRKRGFKTWLAMFITVLALTGKQFEGYEWWAADEAVNVMVLEQESTQQDNRRRFQNIMEGLKLPRQASALKGRLHWLFRSMFKLDNAGQVLQLIEYIKKNNIKLLVLDSLTFMHRGIDTNMERDMGIVAHALQDVRSLTGCAIMWLAHIKKQGEGIDYDVDNDVRGSSVLADVYDAHIAIRRRKKGRLTGIVKGREFPDKEIELYWNLPPQPDDGAGAIGPAFPTVIEVTGDHQKADAIAKLTDAGWLPGVVYSVAAFRSVLGLTSGKAAELRAQLIKEGKLLPGPDGNGCVLAKGT